MMADSKTSLRLFSYTKVENPWIKVLCLQDSCIVGVSYVDEFTFGAHHFKDLDFLHSREYFWELEMEIQYKENKYC